MLFHELLAHPATAVAPLLLGATLTSSVTDDHGAGQTVTVRLTEVEAYLGEVDPGSHAFRGRTARNEVMFGPAGRLYVYFTYGMHWCANVVTGAEGQAQGVLLRAGEIVEGVGVARRRRLAGRQGRLADRDLARGPARLAQALGITGVHLGHRLCEPPLTLSLPEAPPTEVASGPRVGVSGPGGDGEQFPWRFWVPGESSVSTYRPAVRRRRR